MSMSVPLTIYGITIYHYWISCFNIDFLFPASLKKKKPKKSKRKPTNGFNLPDISAMPMPSMNSPDFAFLKNVSTAAHNYCNLLFIVLHCFSDRWPSTVRHRPPEIEQKNNNKLLER